MKSLSLHVSTIRFTDSNTVHPVYASSLPELYEKMKEVVTDYFKEDLEDFDVENSVLYTESEGISDALIKMYKEHLDEKNFDRSFEIHGKDEVSLILNNQLDILDIEVS